MKYNSKQVAELLCGDISEDFNNEITITSVLSDSRKIEGDGNLFIALKGDHFDGHGFVAEITSSGKNFALIEDLSFAGKNTICVPDVRKSLYDFAIRYREEQLKDIPCVAVTGSVGKTSTKEYVAAVFGQKYGIYKSPGNQNSYTGLPMVILNCPDDAQYMVTELGMNTAGEISKLSHLVKPNIGIITNIGWSHSEYLGGRENIYKEKLDITVGMNGGTLVVNDDDDMLCKNIDRGCRVVRCSAENKNVDFYCNNIIMKDGKTFFEINGKKMFINHVGVHSVKNATLAFAAGICAGVPEEEAAAGLGMVSASESRIKRRDGNGGCVVIEDCYNAAPESMRAALDYLNNCNGFKVAVLGDMLELGEFAPTLHKEVGKYASTCCDKIICFGDFSEYIRDGAREGGAKDITVFGFNDREKLIETVRELADKNVHFLFKASNRMRFGDVISQAML